MNNSIILNYLQRKGYGTVSTDYYNFIQIWENWWKNQVKFHKYHDSTGKERKMFTLGMAKRLCEDWASVLYSEERDEIKSECKTKEQTAINNKYLEKQLKKMKFYKELPEVLEKGMAMGTAGAVLRINNIAVDKNNTLIATPKTKTDIIYLNAKQIVPLKVEHGKIVDVAFISESTIKDKKEYYIEIHELIWNEKEEKYGYKITNTYLNEDGNEVKKANIIGTFFIDTDVPLFSIFKPAIANPLEIDYNTNGLGYSVFGNAINALEVTDITYHNFAMDFYLGGKKVFYNKKIVDKKTKIIKNEDGTEKEVTYEVYPDDITRQQWKTYGDEIENLSNNPAITEYNPDLRVEDDTQGIQFALDILSFKAGLGVRYYQFNAGSVVTATQYTGDRQDFVKNANKHRGNVNTFICDICRGILLLGRLIYGENVTEDCEVSAVDQDGFMIDTETAKQEFRLDIAQGIRQPWEYRVKFLGEDEETAKAMIDGDNYTDEETKTENKEDNKSNTENKKKAKKEEEKGENKK